jgi:hypothetical protein
MTRTELQNEALERARTSQPAIFEGLTAKGVPEADIKPRENVFTVHEGCPPSKAVLEVAPRTMTLVGAPNWGLV